jgi:polyisoprenyl-teichoic acid--peptidoglycan teichoic acid transferase
MSLFFPDADAPGEPAVHPRRHRGRWVLGLLAVVAAMLTAAVVAGTGYLATVSHSVSQNLQHAEELPPEIPVEPGAAARPAKKPAAADAVNFVVLGSDSRTTDAGQGRSDVLMVLHLAGDRKSASLISFPRDLYVPIPGHGKNKINAAFALGGTPLTVRTLEGLLGTRMDHVALIDFEGFVSLTEQLGGVTVDNPHPSVSQGYSFPTGRITVAGPEALAYVRERKQLPRGDLDRAERQRLVARAVLEKGLSKQTLLNPVAFNAFVGGLAQQVTVDKGLTVPELRRTALSVRFDPTNIASLQAPITGFGSTASGQSIDVVDQPQLQELAAALQDDRMSDYVAGHPEG